MGHKCATVAAVRGCTIAPCRKISCKTDVIRTPEYAVLRSAYSLPERSHEISAITRIVLELLLYQVRTIPHSPHVLLHLVDFK